MNKIIEAFLKFCADLAGIALLSLMTLTVLDILGRHLHLFSLRGTIELSTAVTVLIGFLAFPYSLLRGVHLVLDTFTLSLPPSTRRTIDVFWYVIGSLLFIVMAFLMWGSVVDAYRANDTTMDLQMPMVWLWVPAAIGISLSPLACWITAWRRAGFTDE